jgi:hypothetical protein
MKLYYVDNQEVQIGDTFCVYIGRADTEYWVITDITRNPPFIDVKWVHVSGIKSISTQPEGENTGWTLVKRVGPKVIKKNGFSKFISEKGL